MLCTSLHWKERKTFLSFLKKEHLNLSTRPTNSPMFWLGIFKFKGFVKPTTSPPPLTTTLETSCGFSTLDLISCYGQHQTYMYSHNRHVYYIYARIELTCQFFLDSKNFLKSPKMIKKVLQSARVADIPE